MAATFRSSTSSASGAANSITLNLPAGSVAGDALFAYFSAPGGINSSPSGWTSVNPIIIFPGGSGTTVGQSAWYKIATSSDISAGNFTWGFASMGATAGVMVSYVNGLIDAVTGTGTSTFPAGSGTHATTTFNGASVTTTQANETVLAFWVNRGSGTTTLPGGVTSRASTTAPSGPNVIVGDYAGPGTPGTSAPGTASFSSAQQWGAVTIAVALSATPLAPTLNSPINGAYADVYDTGGPFTWTYNPQGVSGAQTGYQFRQKTTGAYVYWNATTPAFQSSPVTNATSAATVTFPATVWANDTTFNWSVANQATSGATGPFASDFTVNTQFAPLVSVVSPTGTWSINQTPTVTWSNSLDPLGTQGSYRVVTYSLAQYTAAGFTPGTGSSLDDSGVVNSTSTTYTTINAIANNTTVRSYVQVVQSPGGQTSAWAFTGYTVSLSTPATPTITALPSTDPVTGCPRVTLQVQTYDNYLTANQAAFVNGNTTGWAAGGGTTLSAVTSPLPPAAEGTYSMQMAGAGTLSANTPTGLLGIAVNPSQQYTALASFRTISTARSCTVAVSWYDATGAFISTSTSTPITNSSSAWTQALITVNAPANAKFASVLVSVAAAAEHQFVAEVSLAPFSVTTWTRGGLVGSTTLAVLRNDGEYVRGATNMAQTTVPATQQVTLYDYEATPFTQYTYEAFISVVISGNLLQSTAFTSAPVELQTTGWWELDPTDPSTAVNANTTNWNPMISEQSAAHLVMGQATPNIIANAMGGTDGSVEFQTFDAPTYNGLQDILTSQKTIFISDPFGLSYYVRFGPSSGGGGGSQVLNANLQASTAAAPYRITQSTFVAQLRPAPEVSTAIATTFLLDSTASGLLDVNVLA